jgi:hypothetical protein
LAPVVDGDELVGLVVEDVPVVLKREGEREEGREGWREG